LIASKIGTRSPINQIKKFRHIVEDKNVDTRGPLEADEPMKNSKPVAFL
jgi:hypothetical protein